MATSGLNGQEPDAKPVIVIESWVVAIDIAKLRSLDLTCEQLNRDGSSRKIKLIDALQGKADHAQILQRPDELLKLLMQAGVAQVLAEPKIATASGKKATLEIGRLDEGLKLEITPIAKANGQIKMSFQAEINEKMPAKGGFQALLRGDQPGTRHWQTSGVFETESGMVALDATHARTMPNSPTPVPIVLVRATIEMPSSLKPAATTANAAYREIR